MVKKLGVEVDADNIEACHRIKKDSDRTIVKFSKRKDCQQVMKIKKDLKNMSFTDIDLPTGTKIYINESLCYIIVGCGRTAKKKKMRTSFIHFITLMGHSK